MARQEHDPHLTVSEPTSDTLRRMTERLFVMADLRLIDLWGIVPACPGATDQAHAYRAVPYFPTTSNSVTPGLFIYTRANVWLPACYSDETTGERKLQLTSELPREAENYIAGVCKDLGGTASAYVHSESFPEGYVEVPITENRYPDSSAPFQIDWDRITNAQAVGAIAALSTRPQS